MLKRLLCLLGFHDYINELSGREIRYETPKTVYFGAMITKRKICRNCGKYKELKRYELE